jgi:hypothetical protein
MCEQQYQAEVLDELKQQDYNIKLETEKGKYERAINDKCRRSSRAFERHTCLGQTSMCKQENQCCTSRQSMGGTRL